MRRLQIRRDSSALLPGTAVCMGAFDGLHLGHRALIERARGRGSHVGLVTFDPHPQRVLAPDRPLQLLLSAAQRERTAAALGVDTLVLLPFDAVLAKQSAEDFIDAWLVPLRPTAIVVGADFRFGAGRRGDTAMLQRRLPDHGIVVEVVEPIAAPRAAGITGQFAAEGKIGSTAIREAIVRGDVAAAAAMLGRPHAVVGSVVEGDRRGRTIGFPTANLDAPDALMPALGVYAVWLTAVRGPAGLDAPVAGVANLGVNPTFAGTRTPRLEVHVIDRDLGDSLYGAELEVWFAAHLRGEERFDGKDALVAQIHRDVVDARARLRSADADGVLPAPAPAEVP
jgi:riboflavin kinase/FMN adenylyltransferase